MIPSQTPFRLLRNNVEIGVYKYITDAFAAAATGTPNNDTIKVVGGVYTFTPENSLDWVMYHLTGYGARSPITIEAEDMNNPPVFDWSAAVQAAGTTVSSGVRMEPSCTSLTIRGLHFISYQLPYADSNCGIYALPDYPAFITPATLIIDRCFFDRWTNGVITSTDGVNLSVIISNSVFKDCLGGDARTHGIYIGHAESLTVTGSCFKTTSDNIVTDLSLSGHLLKSRAKNNTIIANYFYPATGCLCDIDLSNGGIGIVTGNIIIHNGTGTSGVSENPAIKFGAEQRAGQPFNPNNTIHTLLLAQNTIRKNQESVTTLWNPVKVYDDMIDVNSQPVTATVTSRNNIVAGPYASLFTDQWPNNTSTMLENVSDFGACSLGPIVGNPLIADASLQYVNEFVSPRDRTDTFRGAIPPTESGTQNLRTQKLNLTINMGL